MDNSSVSYLWTFKRKFVACVCEDINTDEIMIVSILFVN